MSTLSNVKSILFPDRVSSTLCAVVSLCFFSRRIFHVWLLYVRYSLMLVIRFGESDNVYVACWRRATESKWLHCASIEHYKNPFFTDADEISYIIPYVMIAIYLAAPILDNGHTKKNLLHCCSIRASHYDHCIEDEWTHVAKKREATKNVFNPNAFNVSYFCVHTRFIHAARSIDFVLVFFMVSYTFIESTQHIACCYKVYGPVVVYVLYWRYIT